MVAPGKSQSPGEGGKKADRNDRSLGPDMRLAQPQPTKEQHGPGSSSIPTTPVPQLAKPQIWWVWKEDCHEALTGHQDKHIL